MPTAPHFSALLLVLFAACSSSPPASEGAQPASQSAAPARKAEAVTWQPAPPRLPLQLGNRRIDPNVKSVHPPGTRIDLARLPAGERRWVMPGGVKLPFLNGVIDGPALAWPEGLSPAPVVAVTVDDDGMEWYVFADDSRGTCQFTWRADLKRWDPTTKVVTSVARVAWKPALPRSPLALNDRKSDPSVKSAYPPGTRIDLAPLPIDENGWSMPDGTKLPVLNGVTRPPALSWTAGRPLAPVVAVTVDDDGIEWYVFGDGSQGSCHYQWRADLKRWDATTIVISPSAPQHKPGK